LDQFHYSGEGAGARLSADSAAPDRGRLHHLETRVEHVASSFRGVAGLPFGCPEVVPELIGIEIPINLIDLYRIGNVMAIRCRVTVVRPLDIPRSSRLGKFRNKI